jgi:D-glycero-D-manno-heptose 1,7-bisphosphate phosphatase
MIKKEYAPRKIEKPLIILDRDGTLNQDPNGYTHNVAEIQLTDFAKNLRTMDVYDCFQISIASNQSGIARGIYTAEQFFTFTESLVKQITGSLSNLNRIIACPHLPGNNCLCRKPANAMLAYAAEGTRDGLVCFIGDRQSDQLAAESLGIKFFYVNSTTIDELLTWLGGNE